MTPIEKPQIVIAVAVQSRPDGTYLLTNDMGTVPETVESIDDVLEMVNSWAKIRLAQADAKNAEIVVEFSYPALTSH